MCFRNRTADSGYDLATVRCGFDNKRSIFVTACYAFARVLSIHRCMTMPDDILIP